MTGLKLFKISNGALKAETLPCRLKILSWGENDSVDGKFTVGPKTAAGIAAQAKNGFERVAIDFNHSSVQGSDTYRECIKEGMPPIIFGYGRPDVVNRDGLYLEDVIWTPSGQKHAGDFEDISPALGDENGEVTMLHSIALTPNGKVNDLHFFSADPPQIMNTKIDLARIFNLENWINDRREAHLRLMSSAGGSNDTDADASERLKLLRDAIKKGKRPHRADGTPMPDTELLAMPLDKMRDFLKNTPDGGDDAHNTKTTQNQPTTLSASGNVRNVRTLAEILDEENELRYGRGRRF